MPFLVTIIVLIVWFKFRKSIANFFNTTKTKVTHSINTADQDYSPSYKVTRYTYNEFRPSLGLMETSFRKEFNRLIPKFLEHSETDVNVNSRDLSRIYNELPDSEKEQQYVILMEVGFKSLTNEERMSLPELLYAIKGGLS